MRGGGRKLGLCAFWEREKESEQLRVKLIYKVELALGFSRDREIERRENSRLVNLLIGEDGRALWGKSDRYCWELISGE